MSSFNTTGGLMSIIAEMVERRFQKHIYDGENHIMVQGKNVINILETVRKQEATIKQLEARIEQLENANSTSSTP